jgi:uncharacterized protein with ACT and thioredoxin-like domain
MGTFRVTHTVVVRVMPALPAPYNKRFIMMLWIERVRIGAKSALTAIAWEAAHTVRGPNLSVNGAETTMHTREVNVALATNAPAAIELVCSSVLAPLLMSGVSPEFTV